MTLDTHLRAATANEVEGTAMKYARLLIADAHQNMSNAISRLLQSLFEEVVIVADGESLLEASLALRPNLIIVDLSLPFSGKGNILRNLHLNTLLPQTKVIVLSVHDEPEAVRETFTAGAMGFVLKGAAATDLLAAVNDVLHDHRYISPGVQPAGLVLSDDSVNPIARYYEV
jgi:DNA-binding NarL/FixJ family response regulator